MPLTARNVVRINALFTHVGFYVLEAFAGVKSSKKKGLPRILRLVMLARPHNTSWVSAFTMRCSVAIKTVQVNYDQHASSVMAHL